MTRLTFIAHPFGVRDLNRVQVMLIVKIIYTASVGRQQEDQTGFG